MRCVLSRNVRGILKETLRRNGPLKYKGYPRGFTSGSSSPDDEKKEISEDTKPRLRDDAGNTQLDAFMQLEIKLAKKRKAKQMIDAKDSNAESPRKKVTTKPREPTQDECCGNNCANCVRKMHDVDLFPVM